MDLEIWFKIHTNVSNFETASPTEPYKLLKFFIIFVIVFKISSNIAIFISVSFQIEVAWSDFTVITKLMKNFKSLYGFGGRCLKIRDVCMDFEPNFKVHNLVSVYPKSIKLGQMTNLNMIFHVVVSVYRLVKIWNSPQFPVEFRNGLLATVKRFESWRFERKPFVGANRGIVGCVWFIYRNMELPYWLVPGNVKNNRIN